MVWHISLVICFKNSGLLLKHYKLHRKKGPTTEYHMVKNGKHFKRQQNNKEGKNEETVKILGNRQKKRAKKGQIGTDGMVLEKEKNN